MFIESSCKSSILPILFWRGVIDPKKLKENENIQKVVSDLMKGEYTKGANLEQLQKFKDHCIYSVRLNDKSRLLFADIELQEKHYILLLEHLENHNYEDSKFLKSGVLKKFCMKHEALLEKSAQQEQEWESISSEEASSLPRFGSDENLIDYAPVDYSEKGFIRLNDTQENILTARLPLVVNGPAGSGKSCVALSALVNYASDPSNRGRRAVYVCLSKELRNRMEENWNKLRAVGNFESIDVEFCSYRTLIKSNSPSLQGLKKISYKEFEEWFEAKIKTEQFSIALEDPQQVFEEFQIIAACKDEKEYVSLGKRESLFQGKGSKRLMWGLFDAYKTWLQSIGKYDFRIYKGENSRDIFDFCVVDEAADLSPTCLEELYLMTKEGNIAYFIDTQQDLSDSLSKRIHLKKWMYQRGIAMDSCSLSLSSVYRSAEKIVELSNRWLGIKAYLTGGISDKDEYRKIQTSPYSKGNPGQVEWSREKIDQIYAKLKRQYKETEIAIIIFEEEKREELKKDLDAIFIFTPEEIKGLEFPAIILCKPFSSKAYAAINAKLNDVNEEDLSGHIHRPRDVEKSHNKTDYNRIFTSFTRAERHLAICQDLTHQVSNIHRLLMPSHQEVGYSEKPFLEQTSGAEKETTQEDWIRKAEDLFEKGNVQLFNRICIEKLKYTKEEAEKYWLQLGKSQKRDEKAPEALKEAITGKGKLDSSSSSSKGKMQKGAQPASKPKKESSSASSQPSSSSSATIKSSTPHTKPSHARGKPLERHQASPKHAKGQTSTSESAPSSSITIKSSDSTKQLSPPIITKNKTNMQIKIEALEYLDALLKDPNEKNIKNLLDNKFREILIFRTPNERRESFYERIKKDDKKFSRFIIYLIKHIDLSLAIHKKDFNLVDLLLEQNARLISTIVNKKTPLGYTPLEVAAMLDYREIAVSLIAKGADIDGKNPKGETALHVAVSKGFLEFVKILIDNGANIHAKDVRGRRPLNLAARHNHAEIVKLLMECEKTKKSQETSDDLSPLYTAIWTGNTDVVKLLLGSGKSAQEKISMGCDSNALQLAMELGHIQIAALLLENGVNANQSIQENWKPIHLTIQHNRPEILEILLQHGADIDATTGDGSTAFHLAANANQTKILEILITNGANMLAKTHSGLTALHIAALSNHIETVELLIKSGANIEEKASDGWTALHMAAQSGHIETVKLLINAGANMLAKTLKGSKPLDLAASKGHKEVVELLLKLSRKF